MSVTLRAKLGLLFLAFVALVLVSVGATLWALDSQRTDALVINLAGRQRMLTQRMTWLALAQADTPELDTSIRRFEQTWHALRDGGATTDAQGRNVTLAAAPAALRGQLDDVYETWNVLRAALVARDTAALERTAPQILVELDAIVSAFEAQAQTKIAQLQLIQFASLIGALAVLAFGYHLTKTQIVERLARLDSAAQRIAGGELAAAVAPMGEDEIGALARAFDAMRVETVAARDHLEARVAQRTQELDAAFELSQAIVAELDLGALFDSVTARARALTRARAAAVCLLESDAGDLVLKATSGNGALSREFRQASDRGFALCVLGGTTVLESAECASCAFLRARAPGNCAAAPLRAGKETLGALCVLRDTAEPFSTDEARALTLLANSAAVAIANARLIESGKLQAEQNAALAERQSLAADLHDNLAQTLGFLNLKVEHAQELLAAGKGARSAAELGGARAAINSAYLQVRAALVGLRESPPNGQDFAQRLRECVEAQSRDRAPTVELQVQEGALLLAPVVQTQVVHIVREALANTYRHARAQHISVCATCMGGDAQFCIEDDGCGFDPQRLDSGHHLGLAIMRTRAERCGGRLEVFSAPGKGTRIAARFPLETC